MLQDAHAEQLTVLEVAIDDQRNSERGLTELHAQVLAPTLCD